MKIVKVFYKLGTTGVKVNKHNIHQIVGCVELNGEVLKAFNLKVRPHDRAQIEPKALEVGDVTEEQIKAYPPRDQIFNEFLSILNPYIDPFDKKSKAYLVGYNNAAFDNEFLRAFFDQMGNPYFGAWFYASALDVRVLAAQYLLNRRPNMLDFKLRTVATELGLEVDESKLHDAYNIELTRAVYRVVTGIDFEL
jgi:DNA polymerase-3 subunit epsilon